MDVDQHQQILLQVKCKSVQSALPGHVVSPFNSHGPSEHNTLVNAHKSISGHTFDTPVSLVFCLVEALLPRIWSGDLADKRSVNISHL